MEPHTQLDDQAIQLLQVAAAGYCVSPLDPSVAQSLDTLFLQIDDHSPLQGEVPFNNAVEVSHSGTDSNQHQRKLAFPLAAEESVQYQFVAFDGKRFSDRKRSRYSAERLKEVKAVRAKGACLRCRILKKPVRALFCPQLTSIG
jgi:hypothetical protein